VHALCTSGMLCMPSPEHCNCWKLRMP
jgi:hypothetical protein